MKLLTLILIGLFSFAFMIGRLSKTGEPEVNTEGKANLTQNGNADPDEGRKENVPVGFKVSDQTSTPDNVSKIIQTGGVFGVPVNKRKALNEALAAWYLESPGDCVAWIKNASPYSGQVATLMGKLIEGVAKVDFEKGFELASSEIELIRSTLRDPFIALFQASSAHGADALTRVAKLGIHDKSGAGFAYPKYPDGFDFKSALDQLADLHASLQSAELGSGLESGAGYVSLSGGRKRLAVIPVNLVVEWVKKDYEGAWEWLQEDRDIGVKVSKEDFFRGYRKLVDDYELGETIGAYLGFEDEGAKTLMRMMADDQKAHDVIQGYLSQVEASERLGVISDLWRRSLTTTSDSYTKMGLELISELEVSDRQPLLEEYFSLAAEETRLAIYPKLLEMGHTREQLEPLYKEE